MGVIGIAEGVFVAISLAVGGADVNVGTLANVGVGCFDGTVPQAASRAIKINQKNRCGASFVVITNILHQKFTDF